jgi:energy-coupling factor transport system substrate-specific component
MQRFLSYTIYALAGLMGLAAFFYPFFLPQIQQLGSQTAVRGTEAPILTTVLLVLCLVVLLIEVQGQAVSAKMVAALGVLVAITAVLRFLEVAIPGPAGFSPIFAPIILTGYVFGARFGFLMGTMTILGSALITGGIGPWLPFQMFATGWVGLTAGWLPHPAEPRWQLAWLVGWGFLWGLLYGVIINLYFWPFVAGDAATDWLPGTTFADGLKRYAAFYVAASLLWDMARAVGNVLLILALGLPTMRALIRFQSRFQFEVEG